MGRRPSRKRTAGGPSQETLDEIFRDAPVGVIGVGADGRITYLNRRQCEQSGFVAEEYLGRDYRAAFYPTLERSGLLERFDGLVREGKPYEVTFPRYSRHRDGALISFTARAWRWGDSIIVLNSVDRELAKQLDRYQQLFENASDGIFFLDREGRFVGVNQSFAEMTGVPANEILGQTAEIFLPGRFDQSMARLERIMREGRLGPYELEITTPRGQRTISLNGFALLEDGAPVGVMNIARDVTERIRIDEELRKARDEALQASRLKSAILANTSHEIRTPLNVVLGYLLLLRDHVGTLDDEANGYFETITRSAKRLIETVDAMIDAARLESGTFEVDAHPQDLLTLVPRFLETHRLTAEAKGLGFAFLPDVDSAVVRFDERCLERSISNLVGNAVKFTNEGRVEVTLRRSSDGGQILSVRDTGVGMAAEYQRRLFEPFSQQDIGSTRRFEGLGLGLALARRYVEMNGATLRIESRIGEGTTAEIIFPPTMIESTV